MSYSEVLKKAIIDSKLSHIEISERCKKIGESIVPSYISKLVNGKMPPPSDKISLVLAEALGIDSKRLTLEAYLDKAPAEVIDFLNNARFSMMTLAFKAFGSNIPAEAFDGIKKQLDSMSLSEFLLDISKIQQSNTYIDDGILSTEYEDGEDNAKFTLNIKEPIGIPVKDDSMFPTISKGSQVTLEIKDKYEDGKIICFIKKAEPENIFIRKCFFKDNTVIAFPINAGYISETLEISELTLLGEVVKEIKDFRKVNQ